MVFPKVRSGTLWYTTLWCLLNNDLACNSFQKVQILFMYMTSSCQISRIYVKIAIILTIGSKIQKVYLMANLDTLFTQRIGFSQRKDQLQTLLNLEFSAIFGTLCVNRKECETHCNKVDSDFLQNWFERRGH